MKGIRRDQYGYRVYVRVGNVQREKRYPFDTPGKIMQAWRDDTRVQLREAAPANPRGTVKRDVERYLGKESIKALAEFGARRSHLEAWVELYGPLPRARLSRQHVIDAREKWLGAGVAPKTINHRVRVLRHLYHELDGPRVPTPCDHVAKLREPDPAPKFVGVSRIIRVARNLAPWPFEQAVFLVLTSTGQRPAQLKRMMMSADERDVDLQRSVWWVRPAKGGKPIPVFLNDDMHVAWRRLLAVAAPRFERWRQCMRAWEEAGREPPMPKPALWFDTSDYDKKLYAAGWPRGIRPYNAKHSVGFALAEAGTEWEDIRDFFGHTDSKTSRIYTGLVATRLKSTSQRLTGRLRWRTLPWLTRRVVLPAKAASISQRAVAGHGRLRPKKMDRRSAGKRKENA